MLFLLYYYFISANLFSDFTKNGRLIEVLREQRYDEVKVVPIVKKEVPGPSEIMFFFNYFFQRSTVISCRRSLSVTTSVILN